jgi:5-methyltetrahydropteroyltriglutamate--homocysteine methyltransferase
MRTSERRILTTHTGSLPRPLELTRLYARRSRGEPVSSGELQAAGKAALHWVVARQAEAGVDVANNGEQQRDSFLLYVRDRLSGLDGTWARRQRADVERYPLFKQQAFEAAARARESVDDISGLTRARGEIRYLDAGPVEAECADFKVALETAGAGFAETFLTAPSPGMVSAIVLNEHYPGEEDYLAALAEALRVEYEAIVGSGFLLQLDCPDLARERHNTYQDRPLGDFLAFGNRVIDAINHALRNIPRDRVRMHACWGNYEGPHDCDVPLEDIIPVLRRAKVGGFVLPFANPRHAHEFRHVSDLLAGDQVIVAGVIDTTTNFVEHPEVVADRLERVAAAVGDPRRVIAGTDCGFESIAGKGRVAEDVVWAKLAALSEGAALASARLL